MQDKSSYEIPVNPVNQETKLPQYIEDVRHKHPQATIYHLFVRKEAYKTAALKQHVLVKAVEGKIAELKLKHRRELRSTKAKLRKEAAMKNWWKYACLTASASMIILIVLIMFVTQLMTAMKRPEREASRHIRGQKVPVSGQSQKTGDHVLASVNIFNGKTQGSGVVISKGDKYAAVLSAGHNFKGRIGGTVWVYYADGTYTKAELLALDRERDLALLRVDKTTIIGHSYIPKAIFKGDLCGVGYTEGQGPNYRKLAYNRAYYSSKNKYMWDFSVTSGPFWNGDSGSGVFIDDACVAITSQRDAKVSRNRNKKLYACSHDEILRFLKANKAKLEGCGDYHEKAPSYGGDAPPLWKPNPNIPVYAESRVERMIAELREEVERLKVDPRLKKPSEVPDKGDGLKKPSDIK